MKKKNYIKDEILFKKVNSILANSSFKYWVCHGTLLGIIRDNMIFPWDHDLDFAVWKDEVSFEEIQELFKKNGFEQEYFFGDMDCLHFISDSKKVDISFYKKKDGLASIKWVIPNSKANFNLAEFIAKIIYHPLNISEVTGNFKSIKSIFKLFFSKLILFFKPFISSNLKKKIYKYAQKDYIYSGYSYPESLMKFKPIVFLDEEVPVPIDSKKCLLLTYGKDWETTKKDYTWYNEAKNLIEL